MLVTVFTPTYNRGYILPNAYQSLLKQTNKNFEWLIIDDGSEDDTRDLVNRWMQERRIVITYISKSNGGMHTAHNLGFENAKGDLVFCLDSDDDLDPTCIEKLINAWENRACHDALGIVCDEKYRQSNKVIGSPMPALESVAYVDIYNMHKIKGDKLLVFRSDVGRQFPYPSFKGERFVPLDYKYLLLSGQFLVLNEALYIKEYLADGYTKNINKVYARNPRGFLFYHEERVKHPVGFLVKIKSIIHSTACSLLISEFTFKFDQFFVLRLLLFPIGFLRFLTLQKEQKELKTFKSTV